MSTCSYLKALQQVIGHAEAEVVLQQLSESVQVVVA